VPPPSEYMQQEISLRSRCTSAGPHMVFHIPMGSAVISSQCSWAVRRHFNLAFT